MTDFAGSLLAFNLGNSESSGGGGVTTNVDAIARAAAAGVNANPALTAPIQPNKSISADGKQWQNQTVAAIPIPNPATEANMLAAGFTDVTAGGSDPDVASLIAKPGVTPPIQPQDGISADNKQWQNQTVAAIAIPNPATEANMLTAGFTDVTAGGGSPELKTVGPWTGAAAGEKFGLDPATGARYYVDGSNNWQPVPEPSLENTTLQTIVGNAPANNTVPASPFLVPTRDNGDFHIIDYNDYEVAFTKTAGTWAQISRERKSTTPTLREITTPLAGIALDESPQTAEILPMIAANSWESGDTVAVTTPIGIEHLWIIMDGDGGSPQLKYLGKYKTSPIDTLPNPAAFTQSTAGNSDGDTIVVDSGADAGQWIVNDSGTWEPTEIDVLYRAGAAGGSGEVDSEFNYNNGDTIPAGKDGVVDGVIYMNRTGGGIVVANTHVQRITDGLTIPGTAAGTTTLIGLTDTDNAFVADSIWMTNAAGNAAEQRASLNGGTF